MSSNLGRSKFYHPPLNTTGGVGLYADVEAIIKRVSDDMPSRFAVYSSVANSGVNAYLHGFGVPFDELIFVLYTGTYDTLTRVGNIKAAGYNIQPTSGDVQNSIDITAPSSGGPHTFVLFVMQSPESIIRAEALGNAQPTYIPTYVGQQRFDSVYGRRWVATGRAATTDWKRELGAAYDFVINSNAGLGTHTSLLSALGSFFSGARILVETSQTLNTSIVIPVPVHIVCRPGVNIIRGTAATGINFSSGSSGSVLENARFQGYTTAGDKPLLIDTAVAIKALFPAFASGQASEITDTDGNSAIIGHISE